MSGNAETSPAASGSPKSRSAELGAPADTPGSVRAHGMDGRLFVVSAPSGAGKTTLVRKLADSNVDVALSISHTTRAPRLDERDGVHYHFVSESTFEAMVADGDFLEHADVFGQRYGTSKAAVSALLTAGRDVILEIDWQGARQVRQRLPSAIGIFVLPPSLQTLNERLRSRGQDSEEVIAARMSAALEEMSHHHEFDYLLVNTNFETALAELTSIVVSARLSHGRQAGQHRRLLASLLR